MLAEGRRQAKTAGRGNIRWLHAPAESISPRLGRFKAAVMGQSFHWMDRDRVLETLSVLIEDGGGLAMVNPGRRRPQESWEPTAFEVVARFLGPTQRHPLANPEPENEPAFRRSRGFAGLETRTYRRTDRARPGLDPRLRLFTVLCGEAPLRRSGGSVRGGAVRRLGQA